MFIYLGFYAVEGYFAYTAESIMVAENRTMAVKNQRPCYPTVFLFIRRRINADNPNMQSLLNERPLKSNKIMGSFLLNVCNQVKWF